MTNPTCSDCGETMVLEDPAEFMFDFMSEQCREVELLKSLVAQGVRKMWHCMGCGNFALARMQPVKLRARGYGRSTHPVNRRH